MESIFNIFAVPFGYVMGFIYQFTGSYALSIILFSLLAKLLLMPLSVKSKKGMMETQRIQPKIQALQKKYGNDKTRYNEELQNLYQNEGVSPMGGCGPTLLTFPIMIGLYYVIQKPLTHLMHMTATEISSVASAIGYEMGTSYTAQIGLAKNIFENFDAASAVSSKVMMLDFNFLGIDLSLTPSLKEFSLLWLIPLLSAGTAFLLSFLTKKLQEKQLQTEAPQTKGANVFMQLLSPLMSGYFAFILPSALGLYWISNNVFSIAQELFLSYYFKKKALKADGIVEPKKKRKFKNDGR